MFERVAAFLSEFSFFFSLYYVVKLVLFSLLPLVVRGLENAGRLGWFAALTARHGCKCLPDESITVEDCLAAISSEIGARNILSASRMNKAVVVVCEGRVYGSPFSGSWLICW